MRSLVLTIVFATCWIDGAIKPRTYSDEKEKQSPEFGK